MRVVVIFMCIASLWTAAVASTLDGPSWMVATVLAGCLFFGALLVAFCAANRPRRNR